MAPRPALPPFQALISSHGDDVHAFLVASVGRDGADDCFQETFLAALRAYESLTDDRNLRGWLMTIAHRKAIDHHRSRARAPQPSDALPEMPVADPEPADGDGLWARVGSLPPKQRSALTLRFAGDLAYRQIGEALECSEDAARRNVHEGLRKLREELV